MALIVASTIGFALGEWRGISRKAVNTLLLGIFILVVAIGILAYANSLVAPTEPADTTPVELLPAE